MPEKISSTQALSSEAIRRKIVENAEEEIIEQVATEKDFDEWCESGFNPVAITRNFKNLEEFKLKKKEKTETESDKTEEEEEVVESIEEVKRAEEIANNFQKTNPEFNSQTLLLLLNSLLENDSATDILKKVLSFYPDYTLADEALDFLISTGSGKILTQLKLAKEQLNTQYDREIKAGKNIVAEVKEFSAQGLGNPSSLRDLYRDITGNPRQPIVLFDQLSSQFTYNNMKTLINFLLHSIGADLKSKGPSIPRGELSRLLEETRTLQAILGVYKFFKSRMKLINSQFTQNSLSLPLRLTFEQLSKQFIALLSERYISPDKVLHLSTILGISEEILAQIIVFMQMRDAVKQISPKLYKNEKHKEEVFHALLEALEELEEEEEEE